MSSLDAGFRVFNGQKKCREVSYSRKTGPAEAKLFSRKMSVLLPLLSHCSMEAKYEEKTVAEIGDRDNRRIRNRNC
jgi:hypothetical protein